MYTSIAGPEIETNSSNNLSPFAFQHLHNLNLNIVFLSRPIVANAFPAAAMAVPQVSRAMRHRGSIISNAPSRRSTKLRISSFISSIADDIRSRLKPGPDNTNRRASIEPSPLVIRPAEGRRGTLLSIESILTASSDGRLLLRRGSLQTSATSGSEYGMAFGHMWSIQPQLNRPAHKFKPKTSNNLRVIRLGEDMSKQAPQTTTNQTTTNQQASPEKNRPKKTKKGKKNKVGPLRDSVSSYQPSRTSFENASHLPPIVNGLLRQRSPNRTVVSHDLEQSTSIQCDADSVLPISLCTATCIDNKTEPKRNRTVFR